MKFASLCSGIESASMAWLPLGWQPQWYSEIDPHASELLSLRHSDVPNLGDMTLINGNNYNGAIDVLVGGTPCQSFSIGGLRKGMDDDRGKLSFEFLRIVNEVRPTWVVWENVPGVLSVDGGRSFGNFLGGLANIGYGFAYRILDSQYVRVHSHPRAVPQQRRRVFVVGYLGGDWGPPAATLFERESLQRHNPPSRRARAKNQTVAQDGHGECDRARVVCSDAVKTLCSRDWKGVGFDFEKNGQLIAYVPDCSHNNSHWVVRRVSPREAERLMGFPDDYTLIEYNGQPLSNAHRYRLLGNSMTVNVMSWLGSRINIVSMIKEN